MKIVENDLTRDLQDFLTSADSERDIRPEFFICM
jgi:hypothetical protein